MDLALGAGSGARLILGPGQSARVAGTAHASVLPEFKCLGECLRCFGKWSEASRRGGVNVLLARYLTVGAYGTYGTGLGGPKSGGSLLGGLSKTARDVYPFPTLACRLQANGATDARGFVRVLLCISLACKGPRAATTRCCSSRRDPITAGTKNARRSAINIRIMRPGSMP